MNLPVKKIELVLPKNKITTIVDKLQTGGFLEVIPDNSFEKIAVAEKSDYKLKLSEASFALSFLDNFKPKENFAKNLIFSFIPLKETIRENELQEIAVSPEIKKVVEKCAQVEEEINLLESKKENLLQEVSAIERFQGTSVRCEEGASLNKARYFAGSVDIKEKEEFLNEISSAKNKVSFLEKGKEDSFLNFVLFYLKKDEDYFADVFKKHNAKEEVVFWKEDPDRALEKRRKETREIELELGIQKKEAQKLLFFVPKLKALTDWLSWEIDKEEFLKEGEETRKYLGIRAWVAEEDMPEIKKIIEKITPYFLLKEIAVSDDDNPPVIIKNEGVVSSFGIVTGVYGLPKKNELDPTPYLAPFFIFYFALALSDSGYGLLLVAFSFLAKKMFKSAGVDKFFNLFIIGGILTIFAGIFSGTVFGSDIAESLRIIDPVKNPVGTLVFVLALGFFQIFVGLIIGMIWLIKKGKLKEAISGNGASAIFLLGIALFLATGNSAFVISGLAAMVLLAIFYAQEKGIFSKIGKGFGSLYGIIGYLSDVLSYSRILALGLATGIIAAVINMLAVIFKDMIPIPGINWLVAGIVLIVGHTGNLLINALGAFIHSARLQFVEFFSKFMEGGGRYFKPLSKKGRFIEIIN